MQSHTQTHMQNANLQRKSSRPQKFKFSKSHNLSQTEKKQKIYSIMYTVSHNTERPHANQAHSTNCLQANMSHYWLYLNLTSQLIMSYLLTGLVWLRLELCRKQNCRRHINFETITATAIVCKYQTYWCKVWISSRAEYNWYKPVGNQVFDSLLFECGHCSRP